MANGLGILGSSYSKDLVWALGTEIPGYDRSMWRYDAYGNVMKYSDYGNRNSSYGWEIDHYPVPVSLGGGDHLGNLRPLNCSVNASGDYIFNLASNQL